MELTTVKETIKERDKAVHSQNRTIEEQGATLDARNKELDDLKAAHDGLKIEQSKSAKDLESAQTKFISAEKLCLQRSEAIDDLEKSVADLKAALDKTQNELAATKGALVDTQKHLADTRGTLEAAQADVTLKISKLKKAFEDIKELHSERRDLKEHIREVEQELADTQAELKKTQMECSQAHSNIQDLKAELHVRDVKIDEQAAKIKASLEHIAARKRDQLELTDQLRATAASRDDIESQLQNSVMRELEMRSHAFFRKKSSSAPTLKSYETPLPHIPGLTDKKNRRQPKGGPPTEKKKCALYLPPRPWPGHGF